MLTHSIMLYRKSDLLDWVFYSTELDETSFHPATGLFYNLQHFNSVTLLNLFIVYIYTQYNFHSFPIAVLRYMSCSYYMGPGAQCCFCNQIFQLMETNGPSIGGNRRFADVYICNMRVCRYHITCALHQRKENSNDLETIFHR